MKPLTVEENILALDQLLSGERAQLARLRWQIQIQRDVLNSPAESVTALEVQAIKSTQAIEWMEDARETLAEVPSNGLH